MVLFDSVIETKKQTLPNVPFFSMRRVDSFINEFNLLYGESHIDSLQDDFTAFLKTKIFPDSAVSLLDIKNFIMSHWDYDADGDTAGLLKGLIAKKYFLKLTAHDDRYIGADEARQATHYGTMERAKELIINSFVFDPVYLDNYLTLLLDYIQAYNLFAFKKIKQINITLYRGVTKQYLKSIANGRIINIKGKSIQTNSLSSWSTNKEVAKESLVLRGVGYIVTLRTSIKNIFNSFMIDKVLDPYRGEIILRQRKMGYIVRDVEKILLA